MSLWDEIESILIEFKCYRKRIKPKKKENNRDKNEKVRVTNIKRTKEEK